MPSQPGCPSCAAPLRLEGRLPGERVHCSRCETILLVAADGRPVVPRRPPPPERPGMEDFATGFRDHLDERNDPAIVRVESGLWDRHDPAATPSPVAAAGGASDRFSRGDDTDDPGRVRDVAPRMSREDERRWRSVALGLTMEAIAVGFLILLPVLVLLLPVSGSEPPGALLGTVLGGGFGFCALAAALLHVVGLALALSAPAGGGFRARAATAVVGLLGQVLALVWIVIIDAPDRATLVLLIVAAVLGLMSLMAFVALLRTTAERFGDPRASMRARITELLLVCSFVGLASGVALRPVMPPADLVVMGLGLLCAFGFVVVYLGTVTRVRVAIRRALAGREPGA